MDANPGQREEDAVVHGDAAAATPSAWWQWGLERQAVMHAPSALDPSVSELLQQWDRLDLKSERAERLRPAKAVWTPTTSRDLLIKREMVPQRPWAHTVTAEVARAEIPDSIESIAATTVVDGFYQARPYVTDLHAVGTARNLIQAFNDTPRQRLLLSPFLNYGPKVSASILKSCSALKNALVPSKPTWRSADPRNGSQYRGLVIDEFFHNLTKSMSERFPDDGWGRARYLPMFECAELGGIAVGASADATYTTRAGVEYPVELKTFRGKITPLQMMEYLNQVACYQIANDGTKAILILVERECVGRRTHSTPGISTLLVHESNIERAQAQWARWGRKKDLRRGLELYRQLQAAETEESPDLFFVQIRDPRRLLEKMVEGHTEGHTA